VEFKIPSSTAFVGIGLSATLLGGTLLESEKPEYLNPSPHAHDRIADYGKPPVLVSAATTAPRVKQPLVLLKW